MRKPTRSTATSRPKATTQRTTKSKTKTVAKPKQSAKRTPPRRVAARADLGAPIDGFFGKQAPHLRPILDELRAMIDQAAPEAASSIKWGMPFFTVGGNTLCALAAFKAHINLILPGPPGTYSDPDGKLEGDGKTGKHLKIRTLDELPRDAVHGWLATAAARARQV